MTFQPIIPSSLTFAERADTVNRGMPPDAPQTARQIILWVLVFCEANHADYCTTSIRDLAQHLGCNKDTVSAAFDYMRGNHLLVGATIFQDGTQKIEADWGTTPPLKNEATPDTKFRTLNLGKRLGQKYAPNYTTFMKMCEIMAPDQSSQCTDRPDTNSSQCADRPDTVVSGVTSEGREGEGDAEFGHGEGSRDEREYRSPTYLDALGLARVKKQLDELFIRAGELRGMKNMTKIVGGSGPMRALRNFIAAFPAKGRWSSANRVVNGFAFWVEHQARTGLKDPIRAFISQYLQVRDDLERWETDHPDEQYVTLPTNPKQPAEAGDENNFLEIAACVFRDSCGFKLSQTTFDLVRQTLSYHDICRAWIHFTYETDANKDSAKAFWDGGIFSEVDGAAKVESNATVEEMRMAEHLVHERQAAQKRLADERLKKEQAIADEQFKKDQEEASIRARDKERAERITAITKLFGGHGWKFDGTDKWTAEYGTTVQLSGTSEATIINKAGRTATVGVASAEELLDFVVFRFD
jgi:hypothetical protein